VDDVGDDGAQGTNDRRGKGDPNDGELHDDATDEMTLVGKGEPNRAADAVARNGDDSNRADIVTIYANTTLRNLNKQTREQIFCIMGTMVTQRIS
jgi:hypothetical protein